MSQMISSNLKAFYLEREEERKIFRELVTTPSDSSREHVLLIKGEGGVGKTWLLHDLLDLYLKENPASRLAFIDCYDTECHSVEGFVMAIIQQLGKAHFPQTEDYLGKIGQMQHPWERYEWYKYLLLSFVQELGWLASQSTNKENPRRTVLFVDTFEMVQPGEVGQWLWQLLPDLRAFPILVVIAGRPLKTDGKKEDDLPSYILAHQLAKFTVDQIENYLNRLFGTLQPEDLHWLAERIYTLADEGEPLWIVAADGSNLIWLTKAGVSLDTIRDLQRPEVMDRLKMFFKGSPHQYKERLLKSLFNSCPPVSKWLILYAARLHRRFNSDIASHLMEAAPNLAQLADLSFIKYRISVTGEISCLLHDLIREEINRIFWYGNISQEDLRSGLEQGAFAFPLRSTVQDVLLSERVGDVRGEHLRQIREGIDWTTVIQYYVPTIAACSTPVRRQALQAEQFCYELRLDTENVWPRWRRAYYEAFEAYQRGYCGQLEAAALSTWESAELAADMRKQEIVEMAGLRRRWWAIRDRESRKQAIEALEEDLKQLSPTLEAKRREWQADVYAALGWAYNLDGQFQIACGHRECAAKIFQELNLPWDQAFVLDFLGESYYQLGFSDKADEAWDKTMKTAQRIGDRYRIASVAMKWGHALGQRGESRSALNHARLAVALFRELEDLRSLGLALNFLGRTYVSLDNYVDAQRALEESQIYSEQFEIDEDWIRVKLAWGEFYRRRARSPDYAQKEDVMRAIQNLEAALRLAEERGLAGWKAKAQEELEAVNRGEV